MSPERGPRRSDAKNEQLETDRRNPRDPLTTDQGTPVADTDNSLRAGDRGPTLLEDFHLREKITHFDHERIPERVVHARGAGAYGFFEPYESLEQYTCADFLTRPDVRTPVFVRFSTVAGSRGSADTARDVRGFAVKFYTEAGNFDLVGNNMPVFFIQDGIKFPDFVHAVKPEPHNEIPQAASAHTTLWDFVQLQPETTHMMMWVMSDRALPRSYRMMQGFGVHTFRLVDARGRSTFVKFHWKPLLGVHCLSWEEAQAIAGLDPDFHRRDLWNAIEAGQYPEWELGVQLIPDDAERGFDFDLLDPTKLVPEELVPVRPVGRMVLDRNPDDFFAETEQVAFHVGNLVPGIDVTDDSLLQARLFSYLDTQLTRLGGPNFPQLPVNRPLAPVANHQRDGMHQTAINRARAAYEKNSVNDGRPAVSADGYRSYPEPVDGTKLRRRPESFADHFTQAAMFWRSMADWERTHIVEAFCFELGMVPERDIRAGVLENLAQVDSELAERVGRGLGLPAPRPRDLPDPRPSPALSISNLAGSPTIRSRMVAVLAADGFDLRSVGPVIETLEQRGAVCHLVGPHDGSLRADDGTEKRVDRTLATAAAPLYDATLVAGGPASVEALGKGAAAGRFVEQTYRFGKAVGAIDEGGLLIASLSSLTGLANASDGDPAVVVHQGVVIWAAHADPTAREEYVDRFTEAIAAHRHHDRVG